MNNKDIGTLEKPNKVNKVLVFIFLGVAVVTIALISFYLYSRYGGAKNNEVGISQDTQGPNALNVASFVYISRLYPAKVGKLYNAIVGAGVYKPDVKIDGKTVTGLPPGLQLTSCSMEFNGSTLPNLADKSSLCKCTIEGTPQQSGDFVVRVNFSIQDGVENVYKDFPLVVNP
ncbi:MAG: hypothetical protein NTZ07_02795 [Candidatus Woesebacteria bacterium]|nr:hypothetical protein [Candidatus Woesebacteria bacterium]